MNIRIIKKQASKQTNKRKQKEEKEKKNKNNVGLV